MSASRTDLYNREEGRSMILCSLCTCTPEWDGAVFGCQPLFERFCMEIFSVMFFIHTSKVNFAWARGAGSREQPKEERGMAR